jgi:hypothetical protein
MVPSYKALCERPGVTPSRAFSALDLDTPLLPYEDDSEQHFPQYPDKSIEDWNRHRNFHEEKSQT